MNIFALIMDIIFIANFIFIICVFCFERNNPFAAIAWILTLILLPVVGFVLYLFLGATSRLPFAKRFQLKHLNDILYYNLVYEQIRQIREDTLIYNDPAIEQYADMIELHLNQSHSLLTQDNEIQLFIDAHDKYDALFEDIRNAKSNIHVLYFIINDDSSGHALIRALTEKAQEGIEVRLIYDYLGSFRTPKKMFKPLVNAGGKVFRFLPPNPFNNTRINYRNHRKIVLIDGLIAYTGGMNIGDEYLGLNKKITPWRDTHIRITGSAVHCLQIRFLVDWIFVTRKDAELSNNTEAYIQEKYFPEPVQTGRLAMQIVSSGPDCEEEQIKFGYIKMINSAKKYVYIETPYFVPDETFLQALLLSASSGVDVRVIIPGIPDKQPVYQITLSYMEHLLKGGVRVYLYNGFIHSKSVLIDDTVCSLGTTNCDIRSFQLHFEINAFIYDSNFSITNREIFLEDLKHSKELLLEEHNKRPFIIKIIQAVLRLFSPLV